jgi:hypothetical protein
MSTRAEQALEKHLRKLKDMGVTITSTPSRAHEAGFADRPFGIIQAAADRLGMGEPAPELTHAERATVARFGIHDEDTDQ